MCGLFGMTSTHLSKGELRPFELASYLTCFRGIDSTGIAITHKVGKKRNTNFNTTVTRSLFTPPQMIHSKQFQTRMTELSGDLVTLAGHSRWATQGSVNVDNAHPFRVKHLVGMHNGTVHGLVSAKEDKTDSQVIYELMAEKGLEKTINEIKYGAYALVWVDQEENTINFIRNNQRPLWFMTAPGSIVMWMSEKWMLERIKAQMNWSDVSCQITELPVHQHAKIRQGETRVSTTELAPVFPTPALRPTTTTHIPFTPDTGTNRNHLGSYPIAGLKTLSYPSIYPYSKLNFKQEEPSLPLLPGPPRTNGPKKKLVGPREDMAIEKIRELLEEGCACCGMIPQVNPSDPAPVRLFWLPAVSEDTPQEELDKQHLFFCSTCIVKNKVHKQWNLNLKEFVHGGYLYDI